MVEFQRRSEEYLLAVRLMPVLIGILSGSCLGMALATPRGKRMGPAVGGCVLSLGVPAIAAWYLLQLISYGFGDAPTLREPWKTELHRSLNALSFGLYAGPTAWVMGVVLGALLMVVWRRCKVSAREIDPTPTLGPPN
jgi:hypothetical protein